MMGNLLQTTSTATLPSNGALDIQTSFWQPLASSTPLMPASSSEALLPMQSSLELPHTFYVATTGSDQNSGDINNPFKTIQYAVDQAQAGDTVLIRGGTYYERQIYVHNSGTATQPIVIKNAPGELVIIDHGLQVSSWTNVSGAIYEATPIIQSFVNDNPQNTQRVVIDNHTLVRVSNQQDLSEGTFWVDPTTGKISVWAIDGVNPASQETVLINWIDAYQPGIRLFDTASYIVLDGLIDRGAETAIWAANFAPGAASQGLTVQNCEIEATWSNAIRFDNWTGGTVINCNIHDTGLVQFPRNSGVNWPHAIIGFHANQITIKDNRIHDNNGEGVGPFLGCYDWTIQHNEVFDNWSVNIYIDTDEGNVVVDGNLIYNTGKYNQYERDFADGIRISNENADINYADLTPGVYNVILTNNIIIGTGGGIRFFPYQNGPSYLTDSLIANNTIHAVVPGSESISVNRGDGVQIVNNIVDSGPIVAQAGLGTLGISVSHNLIPTSQSVIVDSSLIAHDTDIVGIPNYTVGTGFIATNYQLQASSPARNAGMALTEITNDFWDVVRTASTAYTIGAYEFLPAVVL